MLLIIHIIAGMSSLGAAAFAKRRLTIGALAATLASGTWLVILTPSSLGRFCLSGLALSLVSLGLLQFRSKAYQKAD